MEQKVNNNLKLLSILSFLSGFRAYEGVVAIYFASITNSFAVGMTAFAVMNLSSSIFEIPTGLFSDRIGRKKTMIICYFAAALATFVYYLASTAHLLFLGVIVMGFSMAMKSGAISAYVYENLELLGREKEFQKQEGHRQSLGRYALVLSGIAGTAIIYFFDIRTAVLVTFFVSIATLLLSFLLTDIHVANPKSSNIYASLNSAWEKFKQDKVLRDISIARMISYGGGNVEYRFRALLFAISMPDWLVNLLGILNNFISGVAMKYAHKIVNYFGVRHSLVNAEIFDRFVVSVLTLVHQVWSAIVMSTVSSLVFGIRKIATEDLLQSRYSKDQRATMGSVTGLGDSLVYGILGIIIGALADRVGIINTMLITQLILLTSAFFSHTGIKHASLEDSKA